MLETKVFGTYDEVLHFLAENQPDQCAILRQNETEIELAYITEQEDQPTLA